MDDKKRDSLVTRMFRETALLNELRGVLKAGGTKINFFRHPETGSIGLSVPAEFERLAEEVARENPDYDIEIVTVN